MTSTTDVAAWRPEPLRTARESMTVVRVVLAEAGAELPASHVRGTWSGAAADVAAARHVELAERLGGLTNAVHRLESALARAADQLTVLVATVRLDELSRVAGGVDPLAPAGQASTAVTVLAEDLDTELAAALAEVARGLATRPASAPTGILSYAPIRGALVGSASTPAPTADRAGWWAGLTPAQQEAAVTQLPQVVGPGDGLPAWARDRANRILLDRAETDLAAQVTALQPAPRSWRELLPESSAELAGMTTIGTFGGGTRRVVYQQAVAKLDAVRATKQVLDQQDGRARQLLAFDVSGRSARVAVSVGDLDGAAHVAVVVPGFTTTVERDLGGADRVSADLADQAGRAAGLIGDRRDVAVVSWLGYDIPQAADTLRSSHSVVLRESAEAGAASLAAFLKGVPPDRHLTLVGHSYGSTTAGLAVARGGTQVDDLVVLGSPGLGVPTAAALDLPASHVHVLEADDDPVADLGWFGRDPGDLPDVDQLSTERARLPDGSNGARSVGHSSYLAPGTTSQWNVAAVVAGAPSVRADRPPASW